MNSIFLRFLVVMATLNFSGAPVMAENPCSSLGQGKSAEKTDNVIAQFQAWSVFVETNPDECFAVANPVNTTIEPATAQENLCRGALGLTVSYWPEFGVTGQLSFRSGYEFAPDAKVEFIIDKQSFPLVTEAGGKIAWPSNSVEDRKLVYAMRQGSQVTIIGKSAKGINVKDTFTLSGFVSGINLAAKTCSYMLAKLY
jgi:hypothetical protein